MLEKFFIVTIKYFYANITHTVFQKISLSPLVNDLHYYLKAIIKFI